VLRRGIRHHARIHGGLFRTEERWADLYVLMLTAWSFASVFGPLYIARMRETTGHYAGALHVIAAVMLISILLPIIVRPPRREQSV
jgi:MFS-type transporter involved in bile tolerance (Atg22 family)